MKKEYLSLPTCQHCHQKWSYKETMKTLFLLRCPHCKKRNYPSRKFRWREPIFLLIVVIINFVLFPIMEMVFYWKMMFIFVILCSYLLVSPFGMIIRKEEDSFF